MIISIQFVFEYKAELRNVQMKRQPDKHILRLKQNSLCNRKRYKTFTIGRKDITKMIKAALVMFTSRTALNQFWTIYFYIFTLSHFRYILTSYMVTFLLYFSYTSTFLQTVYTYLSLYNYFPINFNISDSYLYWGQIINFSIIIKKEMSRVKAWKQLSYIKNEEFKDNQSVISQSRSTSSYRFTKIRFSKSKIDHDRGSNKNLALATICKAKERNRDHSILNDSKVKSRQNSFASMIERQPIQLSLKKPINMKFQMKAKRFLQNIKKIHEDLKQVAQNMLSNFQRIKHQMQINLIKVTDQLLKMGKDVKQMQKVRQIVEKGFLSIRKQVILLPQSLSQLYNASDSQIIIKKRTQSQVPLTPTLVLHQRSSLNKSKPKFSSLFSSKQNSPSTTKFIADKFDLKFESNEKVRPQTERKRNKLISEFDKTRQEAPDSKKPEYFNETQNTSTQNLQSLIDQMRQILNQ